MKKIFITFFILFLSINYTYADNCKIRSTSSSDLLEYINNNRKIVKEITTQINNNKKSNTLSSNFTEEYTRVKGSIIRVYNEAFDFGGYYSYFKYYAVYPISNEVPYEIKRDYKLLENEGKGLKYLLEKIVQNSNQDIKLNNLCKNISVKCDFGENISIENAMSKLIKNNSRVLDLYRNIVIGEKMGNYGDIILVGNNFELEIEKNYNPQAYGECSAASGGFFERISESITNIGNLTQEGKDGIQKWKDAMNLLLGKDLSIEEYQKIEREVLKRELSRQGIGGDSQSNVLDALEKYNNDGFSENNNFLYNTFNNTRKKLERKLREFKEEVIGDFFKKENTEVISINDVNIAGKNSIITKEIKERVDKLNLELSSFEAISEVNIDNLRTKMINIHNELSDSINTLNGTCKISVEVCMQQDPSRGNCGKCN